MLIQCWDTARFTAHAALFLKSLFLFHVHLESCLSLFQGNQPIHVSIQVFSLLKSVVSIPESDLLAQQIMSEHDVPQHPRQDREPHQSPNGFPYLLQSCGIVRSAQCLELHLSPRRRGSPFKYRLHSPEIGHGVEDDGRCKQANPRHALTFPSSYPFYNQSEPNCPVG